MSDNDAAVRAVFNRGYLIACTNMMNLHKDAQVAADTLAQAHTIQADVDAMDLCEYDAEALAEIWLEPNDPISP